MLLSPGKEMIRFAAVVVFCLPQAGFAEEALPAPAEDELRLHAPPTALFEVTRVADGDTLTIKRGEKTEKLRLLNVDTEEAGKGGKNQKASKPQTEFGSECAEWAQGFFDDPENALVGLWFPDGKEKRGTYGRLLAHVVLKDGTDFNLLLVRSGKSPYFNKYGNSRGFEKEFREAQAKAQEEQLGIWNPLTNQRSAKRPYHLLLPWWEARGSAIDVFNARRTKSPLQFLDAADASQLKTAVSQRGETPRQVSVFGLPQRIFIEEDRSRTILFRSSYSKRALRVRIPAERYAEHERLNLDGLLGEYRQNYVWVTGFVREDGDGFDLVSKDPQQWSFEPKYPTAKHIHPE